MFRTAAGGTGENRRRRFGEEVERMATYREIDPTHWKRAMHCAAFRNSVQPQYCVSFELDITSFLQEVREKRVSFYVGFGLPGHQMCK